MTQGQLQHLTTALGRTAIALLREIGRGGMATVYLADDPKHHRQVAIKVFDAGVGRSPGQGSVSPRNRAHRRPDASAHPAALRFRHRRRRRLLRDALRGGEDAARRTCPRRAAFRSRRRCASSRAWPMPWRSPIARASSIATSSRRTCCCRQDTRSSPTSASRGPLSLAGDVGADADRHGRRHAVVHEPGADGGRQHRGWPERHLQPWLPALRGAHRLAAFHKAAAPPTSRRRRLTEAAPRLRAVCLRRPCGDRRGSGEGARARSSGPFLDCRGVCRGLECGRGRPGPDRDGALPQKGLVVLPFGNLSPGSRERVLRRRPDRRSDCRPVRDQCAARDLADLRDAVQGDRQGSPDDRPRAERPLRARGQRASRRDRACVSPRSSSRPTPTRTCGPRSTRAASRTCSRSRRRSRGRS